MSNSYQILRTLIALVGVKPGSRTAELKWLRHIISKQKLTAEEVALLEAAFVSPPNYFEEFERLTSYLDREKVLQKARVLFHVDGNIQESEQAAYKKIFLRHQELTKELSGSFQRLGKELIALETKRGLYRDLEEAGRESMRSVFLFGFFGTEYLLLRAFITRNRFLYWLVGLILISGIIFQTCAMLLWR
jgi:hypothetical protein